MNKVTLVAAATALALGLAGCGDKQAASTPAKEAPAKEQTAAQVKAPLGSGIDLENIDQSVRAQDDFFYHINGKWLERTEIPADKSNYGSFTALYEQSQAALKKVMEAAAKNTNAEAGSDEAKLGAFYNSYMDTAALEEKGVGAIKPYLAQIDAVTEKSGLEALMANLRIQGGTTPFSWFVNNDAKNSSQYALYVSQSGLGLPDRDYYLKDTEKFSNIRAEYQSYITDMLSKVGVAEPEQAAKDILALETKLADAQWTRVQSRDATKAYNKMSIEEVNALTGDFNFAEFINASDLNVEEVIVRQPSYFEGMGEVFADTDLATWKNYLNFHFVSNYADELSKEFVDRKFAFYSTTLRGVEEQKPRWKKAVDSANAVLGELLGKSYVKDYFPPEAKERMEVLVDNLIKGYAQAIDGLDWMSADTKVAAKEKLSKFTPKIGYPDEWRDYSELEIKEDDLLGNFVRYSEWEYDDMRNKLGQPVDRSEWHMTPQTVNAYYNPVNNEIVFPAAILQPPFFNLEADDAVNYGAIGAVIGHELGHGFDDQGAKYDGDGNLRNWWSEQDLEQFQARTAQLAKQYSAYAPFEDASVNGELTLGENIGDLGGLTVAYKAYQISLNGEKAPELDGYTGDQRFFIGWAQVWRRKYRDEELRNRLMTDPHSPSHYRVIGVLPNMPEFYKAFDVKEGDEMYIKPENRVKIW